MIPTLAPTTSNFITVAENCGCKEDLEAFGRMRALEERALSIAANASHIYNVSLYNCSVYCATLHELPTYFSYRTFSDGNSSCACPGATCTIVPNVPASTVYLIPGPPTAAPTRSCRQDYKVSTRSRYRPAKHVAVVYIKVSNPKKQRENRRLPFGGVNMAGFQGYDIKYKVGDTVDRLVLQIRVPSGFVFWKANSFGKKSGQPSLFHDEVDPQGPSLYWSETVLAPGEHRTFFMRFIMQLPCFAGLVPCETAFFEYNIGQQPWDPATVKYCVRSRNVTVKVKPSFKDKAKLCKNGPSTGKMSLPENTQGPVSKASFVDRQPQIQGAVAPKASML